MVSCYLMGRKSQLSKIKKKKILEIGCTTKYTYLTLRNVYDGKFHDIYFTTIKKGKKMSSG